MLFMKHERHDPELKASVLARRQAEGLTYQQLAVEYGIPMSTIAAWGRKPRRAKREPGFVELQVPDTRTGSEIWIETETGLRVGVRPGFDESTLARVLRLLPC